MPTFRASGKLLLTGEYTVLDGAEALAVPTRLGQSLEVQIPNSQVGLSTDGLKQETSRVQALNWSSKAVDGQTWLQVSWLGPGHPPEITIGEPEAGERLISILLAAEELRPGAIEEILGKSVTTQLEFDRDWGLGSSSTLLHCIGTWLRVDPFKLLEKTFGGSGYDLACAATDSPIKYQLKNGNPQWESLDWSPDWLAQTYFVHRKQKQDSREGIKKYREKKATATALQRVNDYTAALQSALHLTEAQNILFDHEQLTGRLIGLPPVQTSHFPDFPGQLKSLGAWGGDFIWALTELQHQNCKQYFFDKGYPTVLGWREMIGR